MATPAPERFEEEFQKEEVPMADGRRLVYYRFPPSGPRPDPRPPAAPPLPAPEER